VSSAKTKQRKGFEAVKGVVNPSITHMIGTLHYAWYKVHGDDLVYSRFVHRYDECPRTEGYVKDESPIITHDSTAPWKMCPDCQRYYNSLDKEVRRREIASGEYSEGADGELIHNECGRTRGRCSCFDI
jgi:hypothetical protein